MIVTIGLPTQETIYTHTAIDMVQMISTMVSQGVTVPIANVQRCNVEIARTECVKVAIDNKSDYILFIDSDMRFPANTFSRLLSHKKDVVGCNASKRTDKEELAIPRDVFGKNFDWKKGGIRQVTHIGMAVTLINMKVFDKMEKPWFYDNYEKGTDNWRAEDYCFCWDARKAGFHIWCDLDLSKEIGHIGPRTWYIRSSK